MREIQMYNSIMSLVFSIVIIIICVLLQNIYPDVFTNDEPAKFSITVDEDDAAGKILFILTVLVILFTPFINMITALLYSSSLIRTALKNKNQGSDK